MGSKSILWALCLVLSSCGQVIYLKNGQQASPQEFNQDKMDCIRDAAQTFPYAPRSYTTGGSVASDIRVSCSTERNVTDCRQIDGGGYNAPQLRTVDANEQKRIEFQNLCMSNKGWRQVLNKPSANNASTQSNADQPRVYRTRWQSCNKHVDCSPELYCVSNICNSLTNTDNPKPETGDIAARCTSDSECKSHFICSRTTSSCQKRPTASAQEWQYKGQINRQGSRNLHESCSEHADCSSPYICYKGACDTP